MFIRSLRKEISFAALCIYFGLSGIPSLFAAGATYTVTNVLTLTEISTYLYGTNRHWQEIAEANHIAPPYPVFKGLVLKLTRAPTLTPEEGDAAIEKMRAKSAAKKDKKIKAKNKSLPESAPSPIPSEAGSTSPTPVTTPSVAAVEPIPVAVSEETPQFDSNKTTFIFVGLGASSYGYEEAQFGKIKGTLFSARFDFNHRTTESRWDFEATSEWNLLPLSSDQKPTQFRSINANSSAGYLLGVADSRFKFRARAGMYLAWGAVNTNTSDYRQIGPELYPQLSYEWNNHQRIALAFRFSPVFTDTLKIAKLGNRAIRSEISYSTRSIWTPDLRFSIASTFIDFDLAGSSVTTSQWSGAIALGF